jgi:hypothetical protein
MSEWTDEDLKLMLGAVLGETIDQIASKNDLDELLTHNASAQFAIRKIERDLAYRRPRENRPLSHIVLPRAHAECLLEALRRIISVNPEFPAPAGEPKSGNGRTPDKQ